MDSNQSANNHLATCILQITSLSLVASIACHMARSLAASELIGRFRSWGTCIKREGGEPLGRHHPKHKALKHTIKASSACRWYLSRFLDPIRQR